MIVAKILRVAISYAFNNESKKNKATVTKLGKKTLSFRKI